MKKPLLFFLFFLCMPLFLKADYACFSYDGKTELTGFGGTQEEASKQALENCTFFSSKPKACRVVACNVAPSR